MGLLVRYGEALGAERLVDTNNTAGMAGSSSVFILDYYAKEGDSGGDRLYSRFDVCADEAVDQGPLQMIETANWVMVDRGTGTVRFTKAALRD